MQITINVELRTDNSTKIEVTDLGLGIAADKVALIFDEYQQVSSKSDRGSKSTGLGLTFCKIAIEAHGGEIGAESKTGEGTTIWFTLPNSKISDNAASLIKKEEVEKSSEYQLSGKDLQKLIPITEKLKKKICILTYQTKSMYFVLFNHLLLIPSVA